MELSRSQLFALEYISKYAENEKREAKATINHILNMCNITDEIFEEAVANLKSHARIALHFHPDRLDSSMKSVAEALFEQGIYKSQFETLLSNGSVSAYPGGERDLWEQRIFGGAYQLEGVTNDQRPKYGAKFDVTSRWASSAFWIMLFSLISKSFFSLYIYVFRFASRSKRKGTYEEFDMI